MTRESQTLSDLNKNEFIFVLKSLFVNYTALLKFCRVECDK